ncbi:Carbamoyl-phosphate synthase small chain [Paraburkholderia aspalathi]|uniref:gamma-glutamyl-gamma-aminobutyrate hydrolase family protein n=1 Tax=Paraburkholderia aspalathi TaxID=1324617 RepID=UPI00190E1527|nr:type 1 glutamine amidotransferase [Paraburkholderia aspalathi]MBK3836706.1 type 1 glutamine amidotransferase [Paraburkholderia aspalathi]CAE6685783.1 Carbamoyl-phosphate synthase small chain [Paraburkholderia aspalathi]
MSENKPENAGKSGSPSSPSATPTPSTSSTPSGATPGASKPDVLPPEPAATLPLSHEDSIQSPIKDVVTPSAAEEAAARSSTDDPDSASTVTPTDAQTARQRDAAEARSSAAASTAQQEAEVHERAARKAGQIYKSPATRPSTLGSSEPLAGELSAPADEAALTANEEKAEEAAAGARRAGSPPPGFGAAPDFTATNPPPPNALPPSPPRYLKQSDSAWTVFGRIIAARARQLFDRAGQRITQRTLRIGVSARIFHPEPGAKGLRGKTLQYLEESIAHWVMSRDVLVFMIPTVGHQGMLHPSNIRLRDYAKHLDGLLLQGGADVSPQSYAEQATSPEWPGDRVRDMYELELLHEFIESGKPVLGVCRGCQLINVAFGGTLYQDIATDVPTAGAHVNENYDQHRHSIHFPDGSTLANMFPGRREAIVNSIHHQAVKTIGRDLNIEAVSASDGIIEAVRYRRAPFVMGVQWHPEFHRAGGPELLDCTPLLDTFLRVARETRF